MVEQLNEESEMFLHHHAVMNMADVDVMKLWLAVIPPRVIRHNVRELRRSAKAATDKDEVAGIATAQEQLGNTTAAMTRQYVPHRKGKLVTPTK